MTHEADRADAIKTLGALIKDIKFAMLTTVEDDGSLRSRPMATQQALNYGSVRIVYRTYVLRNWCHRSRMPAQSVTQ